MKKITFGLALLFAVAGATASAAAAADSSLPEYKKHLENIQKKLPGK